MQTTQTEREKGNAPSGRFVQRIGSTVYSVNIHFNGGGKEPLEAKMFRMMKSDLTDRRFCGNMAVPQAEAPPERGTA